MRSLGAVKAVGRCEEFIFCSDAGLGSENNRLLNHSKKRSYIVTQSIKKLPEEYRTLALNKKGFRCLSDHKAVDLNSLTDDDKEELFYKEEPYSSKKMEQRLLITYSPKYAAYQKEIREKQIERAKAMLSNGRHKKNRKNPNDPARFIDKTAVTKDGEMADILYFLDEKKIAQEAQYDGLYAVCTDLFDDEPEDILKVSESRWQIEACSDHENGFFCPSGFCPAKRPDPSTFPDLFSSAVHLSSARKKAQAEIYL